MSNKYTVGQELIRREKVWEGGQSKIAPVTYTVTRVGRRYGYAARNGNGREVQFHLDTGLEKTEYGGAAHFWTREEYADWEIREADISRLHELVVAIPHPGRKPYRVDMEWFGRLSPEKRRAVLDTMEADEA